MDMEKTVKDLKAQNAQFQQMFLTMAKGQEDLKTLLLKDKRKKMKTTPNNIIRQRTTNTKTRRIDWQLWNYKGFPS